MDGHPAFLLVGVLAGVASGLFGLGGGLVIVPALVTVGASMPVAVGTSLLVVLGNGLASASQHARHGNVRLSRGLWMALGAVPAAAGGSAVAGFLPEVLLTGLFLVMLLIGGTLLLRRRPVAPPGATVRPIPRWAAPTTGAMGGLMAGLFGVGGGAFVVPLQVLLLRSTMHAAVGTSLVVVSASALIALVAHALQGHVAWSVGVLAALGGFVGAPLGVRIAQRLSDRRLRVAFVAFLTLLAGTMLADLVRALGA